MLCEIEMMSSTRDDILSAQTFWSSRNAILDDIRF